VKVSCESKNTPDWPAQTELIHIRKVCERTSVPTLQPVFYEAGSPPGRKFQLKR
jgi:hypothetical protein